MKLRPVCPTYALLQSGHVNLNTPDLLYLSRVWDLGISSFWRVLLARRVTFMSVSLKTFVMKVVSLPTYVKGAHFCVVFSCLWLEGVMGGLGVGGKCVCIGKPLFNIISWIVSSSSLHSVCCRR